MTEVAYHPAGATLKAFHRSDAFVRSIMGPVGSGKSTACVIELLRRSREQRPGPDGVRRTRWAIIRNTYGELTTTTLQTWRQWCPTSLGRFKMQGPITHHVTSPGFDMETIFLALDREDDVKKLLSLELTGAWGNEARELRKAVIDVLTTRVGRFPPARDGGCTWSGIILDTNPCDNEHWIYEQAEVVHPEGWEFFKQPGGVHLVGDQWAVNPAAENLANLDGGEEYYRRAVAGKDDDWVKVYLAGEYGFVVEGKPVFPEYRDNTHSASVEPIAGRPLRLGMDFGLTPAVVVAQQHPDGRWFILDEICAEDIGLIRFAEAINGKLAAQFPGLRVEAGHADPAGNARSNIDERTSMQVVRLHTSLPWAAAPVDGNDVSLRLEAVKNVLNRMVDGKPGIAIHPRCLKLRKALAGGYHYRQLSTAKGGYSDKPEKDEHSHIADALQYLLCGGGEHNAVKRRLGQGIGRRVYVARRA